MNLRQLDFALLGLLGGIPDMNVHKASTGDAGGTGHFPNVHAAGGDEVGLGLGIGSKGIQDGDYVLIGEVAGLTTHDAADEAARQAALACDIAVVDPSAFC